MIKKTAKQALLISMIFFGVATILGSCSVFKGQQTSATVSDLVCGMKIEQAEAYRYKHKDKKYYFCSYNCKNTFKMNPEKFISNACDVKK